MRQKEPWLDLDPAKKALEERTKPEIMAPTDAIVEMTKRQSAAPTFTPSRVTSRVVSLA